MSATFDLTPGQLLIWLGQQQNPEAPIYNMVTTFRIAGTIEADILRQAIADVVGGVSILRSTFHERDGRPLRSDEGAATADVEAIDLGDAVDVERALALWLRDRSARMFDLSRTAIDTCVVRLSGEEHMWFLNQHHLITDAWSTRNIYRAVAQRYEALRTGADLEPVERDLAEAGAFEVPSPEEEALAHWKSVAAVPVEPFSHYGHELAGHSTEVSRITFKLDDDMQHALNEVADEPDVASISRDLTLFQIFCTVLIACLHRTGSTDLVVIGAASASRRGKQAQSLIGLMMEIFSIELQLDGSETLADVYDGVREKALEMFRFSQPGASNAALLKRSGVLLNFLRIPFGDFAGLPTTVGFNDAGHAEPHTGIRLQIRELDDTGMWIDVDFNQEAISDRLQRLFVDQLIATLAQFATDRTIPLHNVDLLPPGEHDARRAILDGLQRDYGAGTLHDRFAEWVDFNPDMPAVVAGEDMVTYRQLDAEARAIRNALVDNGAKPRDVIALSMGKGPGLIAAILGTMRAGCAYLPIDPDLPDGRRHQMLAGARPFAIIREDPESQQLDGEELLVLDMASLEREPTSEIADSRVDIDDPGYVLFTSGSTGEPKAVVCAHRGAVNLLDDIHRRAPLEPGAQHSLWTNVGFDVSVYEIFSAMAYGGTLHIVPAHMRGSGERLWDWMVEQGIQGAYVPPFLLDDLAELAEASPGRLRLQRILVGVEPIPTETLTRLTAAVPGLTVVNGYGPTETSICATLYTVTGNESPGRTPIGRPVQNNWLEVADRHGFAVPIGGMGELDVGGHGVALGYLGLPDATNERFVETNRGRTYRTGDVVLIREDGYLEFKGRSDRQLKMSGHRIEPAEIEKAICTHPAAASAVVDARKVDGRKTLVAYVIGNGDQFPQVSQWFDFLKDRLPSYMIPLAYVPLAEIPRTASGKIDRAALPPPTTESSNNLSGATPRTELEARIAKLWMDVLAIDAVGVHDHFVEIGGDSIQALQIASQAHESGLSISTKDMFEAPTIAGLAQRLEVGASRVEPATVATPSQPISPDELASIYEEFGEGQ